MMPHVLIHGQDLPRIVCATIRISDVDIIPGGSEMSVRFNRMMTVIRKRTGTRPSYVAIFDSDQLSCLMFGIEDPEAVVSAVESIDGNSARVVVA